MTTPVPAADLLNVLPPRVWYLTTNGNDLWCRRPYGFFFSTSEGAEAFARDFGSDHALIPVGINATDLVANDVLNGFRELAVTRLFLDPSIDPTTGDVFGNVLRLGEIQ